MNRETAHAKLPMLLTQLRLPSFSSYWKEMSEKADEQGTSPACFLADLCEHELQERKVRKIESRLKESSLNKLKTLSAFQFSHVPMVKKAHIEALSSGETWIKRDIMY